MNVAIIVLGFLVICVFWVILAEIYDSVSSNKAAGYRSALYIVGALPSCVLWVLLLIKMGIVVVGRG